MVAADRQPTIEQPPPRWHHTQVLLGARVIRHWGDVELAFVGARTHDWATQSGDPQNWVALSEEDLERMLFVPVTEAQRLIDKALAHGVIQERTPDPGMTRSLQVVMGQ